MKRKLLFTFLLFTTVGLNNSLFAQATPTAASALWQPASGANIPGNVAVTGNIQANEQAGTLEAYTYSTSATAVSNATGFQRLRSSSTAPALPFASDIFTKAASPSEISTNAYFLSTLIAISSNTSTTFL